MRLRHSRVRRATRLNTYIAVVAAASVCVGVFLYQRGPAPDWTSIAILCLMGTLGARMRQPDVGSRAGLSFANIILLSAAVLVGPFGAWLVGTTSISGFRGRAPVRVLFNVTMTGLIGAVGATTYILAGGERQVSALVGMANLATLVAWPLLIADIAQCLTNACLLAGVVKLHQGVPFMVSVRRLFASSGVAYVSYGVIGFVFIVLWHPAQLGPFSALLILAPLLAARWALIQYGEEVRSHERTLDTLVTALATKEPGAAARGRRVGVVAEWIAEELGLGTHQIGTVRYAGVLADIGHLVVPTRVLRKHEAELTAAEARSLGSHGLAGARVIEGIDFLEDARAGIRYQHEYFNSPRGPAHLSGQAIPLTGRIVAAASRFEQLTWTGGASPLSPEEAVAVMAGEEGRFDPVVLAALRAVIGKHRWPAPESERP